MIDRTSIKPGGPQADQRGRKRETRRQTSRHERRHAKCCLSRGDEPVAGYRRYNGWVS